MAHLNQRISRRSPWVRIGLALLFAALVVYLARPPAKQPGGVPPQSAKESESHRGHSQDDGPTDTERSTVDPGTDSPTKNASDKEAEAEAHTFVEDVEIRDLDGNVAFRGTVELAPTLSRIASGKQLRFPNDGSVFQNRERRLPRHPAGYYHEWVHPTPGLPGPGPQRIITGERGEVFYTPDHYRTFRRLDE